MRKRVVEILAVVIGVGLIVFYYLDRQSAPPQAASTVLEPTPAAATEAPVATGSAPAARAFPPPDPPPAEAAVVEVEDPVPEVAEAQTAWETARAEVEAVRSSLSQLDARFDRQDAEFERLESEGTDPEALEEQMLIFLDGIVEQYDELEGRLAAAEAAERAAAVRLEALGGDHS